MLYEYVVFAPIIKQSLKLIWIFFMQTTYQDAYHTLKKNAELLQQSEHIDIDALMEIVQESISAFKVCQSRIDAVEKALADAFGSDKTLGDD